MPTDTNLGPVISHGDSFTTPRIQEGAVLNEDGHGLRVFTGTLLVKDTDSPTTLTGSNLPKMGDEIIKGSALYISKLAKRYKWNGQIACDFEAVGIDPTYNGLTSIAIEGAGTVSSEPIESHYNFSKIGGTPQARLNGAQFDPETGRFLGFSPDTKGTTVTSNGQSLAGVRSFLAPKETMRGFIHIDFGKRADVYAKLKGSIGSQSKDGTFLGVRVLPDWADQTEGSWLLTSVNAEPIASRKAGFPLIVKMSYEVTASGGLGWNNLIYAQA